MLEDYSYTVDISLLKTPLKPEFSIGQQVKGYELDFQKKQYSVLGIVIGMKYVSSEFQLCNQGQSWVYSILVFASNNRDTERFLPYVITLWSKINSEDWTVTL